jgi:tripartite-type tricarboxylate transporter receptor subunit TctC
MFTHFRKAWMAAAFTALAAIGPATAQTFPNKPIKIISGYPPGGNNDTGARLFARELEARLKTPVIVENRAGAGGTIATRYVASAPPDGYTILFADINSMTHYLSKNGLEDVFKQLTPVSLMLTGSWVLYASAKLPVKTFDELIAYAKSRPGGTKLNFGATNVFSSLAMGVLEKRAGQSISVHIPYKGQAPVAQAMSTGEVDLAFDSVLLYKPLIDAGKIRALFVTRKSGLLPGVPTAAEAGVPDFSPDFQGGMWVPAGTPPEIVSKLTAEFTAIAAMPDVQQRIRNNLGSEPASGSAEALRLDAEAGIKFQAEATRLANFKPE